MIFTRWGILGYYGILLQRFKMRTHTLIYVFHWFNFVDVLEFKNNLGKIIVYNYDWSIKNN